VFQFSTRFLEQAAIISLNRPIFVMKLLFLYSDAESEFYVGCYLLLLTASDSDSMSDCLFTALELSLLFNIQLLILLILLRVMRPNVGTRQAFCVCFLKNKVPRSPICFAVFQFVRPCVSRNYPTHLVGLNFAPQF
jgi:hypothetical protein